MTYSLQQRTSRQNIVVRARHTQAFEQRMHIVGVNCHRGVTEAVRDETLSCADERAHLIRDEYLCRIHNLMENRALLLSYRVLKLIFKKNNSRLDETDVRRYFTAEQLLQLYQAQVRSCMEYCSHLLDG